MTSDTMFMFEYKMKPISQLLAMEDIDMASITHLPFQTQICYTALDGSERMHVITHKLEVSNERDELENQAEPAMIQKSVLMQGSKLARAGETRQAQAIMKNFNRKAKSMKSEAWELSRTDF